MSDPVRTARARLAIATRNGKPTAALKQDLNHANLVRAIGRVNEEGGLTDKQRSDIAALLTR